MNHCNVPESLHYERNIEPIFLLPSALSRGSWQESAAVLVLFLRVLVWFCQQWKQAKALITSEGSCLCILFLLCLVFVEIFKVCKIIFSTFSNTVEPGFRNLGFRALPWFRALSTGDQIAFYDTDLPGFSAFPGFRNLNHGDRDWFLNPGSTVF